MRRRHHQKHSSQGVRRRQEDCAFAGRHRGEAEVGSGRPRRERVCTPRETIEGGNAVPRGEGGGRVSRRRSICHLAKPALSLM